MERPSSLPDPPLSDGVVALRPLRMADAPALVESCNDNELAYWLDHLPQPYTDSDARAYVLRARRAWRGKALQTPLAVVDSETDAVVGACGIFWHNPSQGVAEIGYWIHPEARGRGIATRAVRLLAGWILGDLSYERLELQSDTRNTASVRVAEKAGFTAEGVIRSARTNARDGHRVDHMLYSLLRSELDRPQKKTKGGAR